MRERLQISLGGFLVLVALVAIGLTAGRYAWRHIEEPVTLLACGLGAFVGLLAIRFREALPGSCALNSLLSLFVIINGLWFERHFFAYAIGVALGLVVTAKGLDALAAVATLCGVSTIKVPQESSVPTAGSESTSIGEFLPGAWDIHDDTEPRQPP